MAAEDDPFGDLVPKTLAFPIVSQPAPAQANAPVPDVSFDDLIPEKPMPGVMEAAGQGLSSAVRSFGQTGEALRGGRPKVDEASPAAAPLAWSDVASPASKLAPKIAYRLAEGAPALAGGVAGSIAGGGIGTAVAPGPGTVAGALAGGVTGTAAVSAAQSLGPYFAEALKDHPDHPEDAYTSALHQAELAGVFGGVSWAAFPVRAFQGPVKQLLFQAFGVQPGVAVAHKAASNVLEGAPVHEGLGQAYGEGAVMTALPMAGHALVSRGASPGVRVPEISERIEPTFEGVGSSAVTSGADAGAVIEPAVPDQPVVKKPRKTRAKASNLPVEAETPVAAGDVAPVAETPSSALPKALADFDQVPQRGNPNDALRAQVEDVEPGSWHELALREALSPGTKIENAEKAVQWASAHNQPQIIDRIIQKAKAQLETADANRQVHPELDAWARESRQNLLALRAANTGVWEPEQPTPQEFALSKRMPQDILGFIRDRGGIKDETGDLKSMGAREKTGIINNKSGHSPDHMRELLVEAGYLNDVPFDRESQSTTSDLYNAVDDALRGRKIYRATDEEAADRINRTKSMSDTQQQDESRIVAQLRKFHDENELPNGMSQADEADIVQRVLRGYNIEDAIERQAMDWYSEVHDATDPRTASPGGSRPFESSQGRKGFEDQGPSVEAGSNGSMAGREEQNPWRVDRNQEPTLDADPNAGAERVRAAITRALPKLPEGTRISSYGDLAEAPGDIGRGVAQSQSASGRKILGVTHGDTGDMYIAQHAMDPDATIGHELVHSLRTKGLISDPDLKLLVNKANSLPDLWDRVFYDKAYADKPNRDELLAQEAAAHLYEARIAGRDFGSRINAILDAIKDFIERVRNGLTGAGFRTAKDVMDAIDSGELAKRSGGRPADNGHGSLYAIGAMRLRWNDDLDEYLIDNSHASAAALAEQIGVTREQAAYRLRQLQAEGRIDPGHRHKGGGEAAPIKPFAGQKANTLWTADQLDQLKRMALDPEHSEVSMADALGLDKSKVHARIMQMHADGELGDLGDESPADVRSRLRAERTAANAPVKVPYDSAKITLPPEERQWLAENYPKTELPLLAERMGYSIPVLTRHLYGDIEHGGSDQGILAEYGIKRRAPREAIERLDREPIRQTLLKNPDMSYGEIAKRHGVSAYAVRDTARIMQAEGLINSRARPENDADVIARIQELRRQGLSQREVAARLHEETGEPWTRNRVAGLRNRNLLFSVGDEKPVTPNLDMSKESRMRRAEEQGFDTSKVLYHGTDKSFDAFRPSQRGKIGPGVYLSNDTETANKWARGDKGSVLPVVVRGKIATAQEMEPFFEQAAKTHGGDVHAWKAEAARLAQKAGFAGHAVQNEVAIFDPSNIRSVSAAFDPAHLGSPNLMYSFGGEQAKTADHAMLAKAKDMEAAGKPRDDIWHQTGWFKGTDGKWKFEIDDSGSKFRDEPTTPHERNVRGDVRLGDYLDHEPLYGAYPSLKDIEFGTPSAADQILGSSPQGSFMGNRIEVSDLKAPDVRSVTAHETQHGIQNQERFGYGASPSWFTPEMMQDHLKQMYSRQIQDLMDQDPAAAEAYRKLDRARLFPMVPLTEVASAPKHLVSEAMASPIGRQLIDLDAKRADVYRQPDDFWRGMAYDQYKRHAGEVESRTVQKRLDMTPEERKARPPWLDYDVPEASQIVRFADGQYGDPVASVGPPAGVDKLGYYSHLDRVLGSLKPTDTVTADTLAKRGVKAAELEARGVDMSGPMRVSDLQAKAGEPLGLREVVHKKDLASDLDAEANDTFGRPYNQLDPWQQGNVRENLIGSPVASAKWSSNSLDPSNPTYRETVLHLPADPGVRVAKHPDGSGFAITNDRGAYYEVSPGIVGRWSTQAGAEAASRGQNVLQSYAPGFHSGHFPEPNIVGHMMTSLNEVPGGGRAFTLDQIQSDWGQKLRDGGVRDEAKIAGIKQQFEDARTKLNEFQDKWPEGDSYKSAFQQAADKYGHRSQFPADLRNHIDGLERAARATRPDIANPEMERALAETVRMKEAELRTAEASSPGHPLVNTTDQWTNTTLRRAIQQAIDSGADHMAIPHGDTVLSYNPGDTVGMREFYGSRTQEGIVPKNLRKLLQKLDPDIPKPQRVEKMVTPSGARGWQEGSRNEFDKSQTGFTVFDLTDKAKEAARRGVPMFAKGGRVTVSTEPLPSWKSENKDSIIQRALQHLKLPR